MKAILWVVANWDQILQWGADIIAAASVVVITLSKLAKALGHKDAEGALTGVAGALDKVAKNPLLNAAAMNPKPSLAAQVAGPAAALKSEPYKGPFTGG